MCFRNPIKSRSPSPLGSPVDLVDRVGVEPTVGFRLRIKSPTPSTTRSTGPDSGRGPTQPVPYQNTTDDARAHAEPVALGDLFACIAMEDHFFSPFVRLRCWTSYLSLIRIGVKALLAGSGGFEPPTLSGPSG